MSKRRITHQPTIPAHQPPLDASLEEKYIEIKNLVSGSNHVAIVKKFEQLEELFYNMRSSNIKIAVTGNNYKDISNVINKLITSVDDNGPSVVTQVTLNL